MSIFYWIGLGLLAGAVAKFLMPGKDPGGCIITILLGIAGALLGGFLATYLGFGGAVAGFDPRSLITAILGSMLLLLAWRLMRGGEKKKKQ